MKLTPVITMLLMAILTCLSACTPEKNRTALLPELQQAEAVMYERPDSALHLLQEMQIPASSDKLQKATWALLMTQARYKNDIKQSDSLINIAYNYFIDKKNAQRKAMAVYYKGIIYHENHQDKEALELFLEAAKAVEQTKDYKLGYLIHSDIGMIYAYRKLNDYAMQYFEKAQQYAKCSDYKYYLAYSYILIARVHAVKGNYKTAIEYYNEAIKIGKAHELTKVAGYAMSEIQTLFSYAGNHQKALQYAKEALQIEKTDQGILGLGDAYRYLNQNDSAYFYLNQASQSNNIRTARSAYQALYYLFEREKDYKKAVEYSNKLWQCQDSISKMEHSRALVEMQEKYNQQKVINEKNRLQIEKDQTIRNMLIALTAMCCLTALLIYIYQRKLIRKERIIQKNEKEIQLNTLKRQENERIISRNQSRMKELEEQMEANKGVQEELEDQKAVLAEIKQQNETLQQENALLQQHIDSHTSSQGEKSQEADRLSLLGEENQRLHDRERFLSNQLIKKTELLHRLKTAPQYMEDAQWEQVKETMNQLFDNYLTKLSRLVPALTESDLQICCFIKLSIPNPGIAELLAISPASVSKRKLRLKERIIQQTGPFDKGQTLDLWLREF